MGSDCGIYAVHMGDTWSHLDLVLQHLFLWIFSVYVLVSWVRTIPFALGVGRGESYLWVVM
jgi:hypothetical protein